jgi:type II secretory ATPase GspE/PulE/Tfp pilus assembly ATPase PilB-like protein
MDTTKNKIKIEKILQEELEKNIKDIPGLKNQIDASVNKDVSFLLKNIMSGSVLLNFSDIHLEALEKGSVLRARIDGVLQEIFTFNVLQHKNLVSRIKLLSGLKLNINDKPQDGRFSVIFNQSGEIEIRASTLPTEHGETIVMRILNPKNLISLEDLGLRKDIYEIFIKEAQRPNGMIIVTGPTGSGKTTTLYAFLKKIRNPEIKVITIEDPIEYHLDGISQTQVNPNKGYTFAAGLRSIVRQDPDAILVGEIRDLETASISLQAALTGHLVLSTIHANDASGTISRFQALGEVATNISPAINTAIAQRLIRKVCPLCAQMKKISIEELAIMQEELKNISNNVNVPPISKDTEIAEIQGCKHCNFTGYKGRVGIFEAMIFDDEIESFILTGPSASAIQKMAISKGMTTMKQDGLIKVLNGITTMEEIKKVVG